MSKIHEVKEKAKVFVEEYGPGIIGVAILTGFGAVIGAKYNDYRISRGIEQLWADNPGLKETMWDAVANTMKKK